MKKIFSHFLIFLFLLFISLSVASAQGTGSVPTNPPGSGTVGGVNQNVTIQNPFAGSGNSLIDFFKAVVDNVVLPIGEVLAVLAFIYSGFLFVTAEGNPGKLDKARTAFFNAVIGTAVLLGAYAIANVVANTINQLK